MTELSDTQKIQEISRLLDEAYKHYFEYEGHCKSSEGSISISYGNYWDRDGDPTKIPVQNVNIYSYVFCRQGREQDFDSLDEALETVRGWHAEEMAYDYNSEEAIENREEMDRISAEFLQTMMEKGKLTIINVTDQDLDGQN